MKNLKLFSLLGIFSAFMFFGCEQSTLEEEVISPQVEKQLQLAISTENGEFLYSEDAKPLTGKSKDGINKKKNPNQISNGSFITQAGSVYEFSAVMNPGGTHGEIEIDHSIAGKVYAETICVATMDGEAIMAFITKSAENPGGAFVENIIWLVKVKDNGEGMNADADQHSALLLYYPDWFNFYDSVEEFLVDIPCELFFDHPSFNVMVDSQGGQIQVY